MNTTAKSLTISRLASLAGVGVETIRYYQRLGLITEPAKPLSGYRTYSVETLKQLKFIARAKQLGFTLKEIAELMQLDSSDCVTTRQLAQDKLGLIQKKITDLQAMTQILQELIDTCETTSAQPTCPILQALSRDD